MGIISIELETWVTEQEIQDSFKDVAEALAEGYGAGTIALYGYTVYPGFWSTYPKELEDGYFLINIDVDDGLSDYGLADAVMRFAETYKRE